MSLKSVKQKIRSIDKTRQVTKAMEAVSAVKMRKSQKTALDARPFAMNALKILQKVSGSSLATNHPLTEKRNGKNTCIIMVSSDRGLAGSLNTSLFKTYEKFLKEKDFNKEHIHAIAVGRRAGEYLSKRNFKVLKRYEGFGDFVDYASIAEIIALVREVFFKKQIDSAWIIYTNFISTLKQEVYIRQLLPLSYDAIKEIVAGIAPQQGRFSELNKSVKDERVVEYIAEPDEETITAALFDELLKIEVYHSILESNASEHSARMIAMKSASDNARDILKDLRLSYNKERQAGITKELNEIVGGVEALTQ